ncbi:hypothetical protein RJ640_026865 [Escallonia rubra]|uniref:Major facilitator superfamily (MFS) profile domain-containing protein n=1 Tax=Escallonia rubra TaxID=112253 RepID=A0AA88QY99_9ASTE|nr:hypothetical protein RJ640_026865 [Escallonia rubra]
MDKLAGLSHLFVTVFLSTCAGFMVIPAITDVTMAALCPGRDECSLAIYLSGFQQAIRGVGAVLMMPLIGNLSDVYGRKALLTLPMAVSTIPLAVLAYSRKTNFFYAYFLLKTLTATVEGSVQCLALAYVADNISEGKRVSAFGVLSGVGSGAFICGTLAARFLSPAQTFQVAALVSMVATVYMRIFVKESMHGGDALTRPILRTSHEDTQCESEDESSPKIKVSKKIISPADLVFLLKSSTKFSLAAVVAFFNSLADGGLQASLLYFLKARFHFNKNQFADVMLISNVSGAISQLLFMPILAPVIGEEKMLSIGLFAGFVNMLLNSIAWSAWVPYVAAMFCAFAMFTIPCLSCIVSKQAGPNEQGKAQGSISGISSFANIISPLIYSPLTALFLSSGAPFPFPGFSIMCIGIAFMIAFIPSTRIWAVQPTSSKKVSNKDCLEA